MTHPRCENPSNSCPRARRWSSRLGRWIYQCDCQRAFPETSGGAPDALPLRGDPDRAVTCPLCQAPMCRVHGTRNGDFWSCSKHPKCDGKRQITPEIQIKE